MSKEAGISKREGAEIQAAVQPYFIGSARLTAAIQKFLLTFGSVR